MKYYYVGCTRAPELNCDSPQCPEELLHPPDDCNVNASLAFTLRICRVEDILIEGLIKGSVVHFHMARTVTVPSTGRVSTSEMGMHTDSIIVITSFLWQFLFSY